MIRINLLSEGRRPTAVRRTRGPSLAERDWTNIALLAAIVLGILVTAGYWFVLDRREAAIREEVAQAEAEVERLRPIIEEVEEFKRKQADLERKIEVITNLKNQQTGPVRVMDAVSRALPELLWLDQMQVSANQIQLSGRAFNVNAVSNFIENLDKVPEFSEPQPGRVQERGDIYEFSISVPYTLTPEGAEIEAENEMAGAGGPAEAAGAA